MALSPSYTLGLIFIVLVSLIWAAASVLVQFVYSDKFSFDSPFLLTYTGVSLFACFLPFQWLSQRWKAPSSLTSSRSLSSSANNNDDIVPLELSEEMRYESIQTPPVSAHGGADNNDNDSNNDEDEPAGLWMGTPPQDATTNPNYHHHYHHWTTRDHIVAAAKIAPMWFISNYAYNASLKFTSITSSTVLASTGSLFTFLFALIARDEHFSLYKFFGIVLGMTGSIVTGLHDIQRNKGAGVSAGDGGDNDSDVEDRERLWGDFLGLVSAVGYGSYALMVRLLCPSDESLMSMQLFLGFVGLWNMVLLSPIAIYQGFFQPTGLTWFIFGCLVGKGLFDNVLSDYLWARAVVLTSATVATVGLGLTIPLAFASDILLGRPNVLDAASIIGALSVLSGFVLVNLGQQQEEEEQQEQHVPGSSSPRPRHETIIQIEADDDDDDEIVEAQNSQDTRPNGGGMGGEEKDRFHNMSMEYRDEPAFQDE